MFIKAIILDGFKSYAQRTEVSGFDPLFNAVTGLNGSGKSNILDGICFVLGITNLSQVSAVCHFCVCHVVLRKICTCGCLRTCSIGAIVHILIYMKMLGYFTEIPLYFCTLFCMFAHFNSLFIHFNLYKLCNRVFKDVFYYIAKF